MRGVGNERALTPEAHARGPPHAARVAFHGRPSGAARGRPAGSMAHVRAHVAAHLAVGRVEAGEADVHRHVGEGVALLRARAPLVLHHVARLLVPTDFVHDSSSTTLREGKKQRTDTRKDTEIDRYGD
eukprot:scaffold3366_cov39-Phaeocystis_antarctica.AAC.2